jgi:hypothetical protein
MLKQPSEPVAFKLALLLQFVATLLLEALRRLRLPGCCTGLSSLRSLSEPRASIS